MRELYHIDFQMQGDKWRVLPSFSHMPKSFALGAWAMHKAYYGHKQEARLRRGLEVIETCGKQTVHLN